MLIIANISDTGPQPRHCSLEHAEDEATMISQNDIETRLAELLKEIKDGDQWQVGYPGNQNFDYSPLIPFLSHCLNNIGDPFHQTHYRGNTHQFEREVILHFAQLTGLDPDDAWGYVTSGGTEGNMYGLYLARELHPEGMLYFSEEAHYSILKIARILNMPHTTVKRRSDGEIDYDDLRDMLTVHRGRPAIILATIGTTMRGAVDDISAIRQIIDELDIGEHYIHADAALSGMILPYVDDPQPFGFDAGIDSISISGHKLIGAPLPCGIVLTRKHLVETLGRAVELVGVNDTTLSGSRNGLTPLMLWYAINRYGAHEWRETVGGMLDTAEYAVKRFNEHGINAWRHRNSPTVVFDRPSQEVFDRWQIAPEGDVAHIITMPHVDFQTIDRLVEDCISPHSEPAREHDLQPVETVLLAQERETERAHATTMQRIVIMAENRIGTIARIAGTLAESGVNLNSIATENEGQHGVVIITTDRTDHALSILNQAGFKAVADEAVLVQLADQAGALANLAGELKDAGLSPNPPMGGVNAGQIGMREPAREKAWASLDRCDPARVFSSRTGPGERSMEAGNRVIVRSDAAGCTRGRGGREFGGVGAVADSAVRRGVEWLAAGPGRC